MYSLNAGALADDDTFVHFSRYINISSDEKIIAVTAKRRENSDKYVVFFTKNGYIKKSSIDEYSSSKKKTGVQAIKLEAGDAITNVVFANDGDEVFIATENGMCIRFDLDVVNPIGRVARGVIAIKLSEGDKVLTGILMNSSYPYFLVTTEHGNTKKVSIAEFPSQGRAGKGIILSKEKVVGVLNINGNEDITINAGVRSICIPVSSIPEQSRTSIGVKTIKDGRATSTAIVR
jgi:DNA gyrase subunit A